MLKERFHEAPPEDKKKGAFTKEQLKEEVFEKLKDDPNYVAMCYACKNLATYMSVYIEMKVPETGKFKKSGVKATNFMWAWTFDWIALSIERGYNNETHRRLSVEVPYSDGTDRMMSVYLCSATNKEIIDFLDDPKFAPKLMMVLDDLSESILRHDDQLKEKIRRMKKRWKKNAMLISFHQFTTF